MRSTSVSTLTVLFHGIRVALRVFKSDQLRSAAINKRRVERIVCGRNVLLSEREHIIAPKIQTSGARRPVFLFFVSLFTTHFSSVNFAVDPSR